MQLNMTVVSVFFICLICSPNATRASQYSYSAILPPGWSWSYVHGINDNGDLVGYGGIDSATKSFIYSNDIYTELLPPGWSSSAALTINNDGKIVGYGVVNGAYKAFTYENGSYSGLLPPGWSWSLGIRINDFGDVVGGGSYEVNNNFNFSYGFLYNGSYTELRPPGWSAATAYGINNDNAVVGWGTDGSGFDKGYIYSNGSYTEILPPGWISATAYNINNAGEVIGEGTDGAGNKKGYIYSNGIYLELLPPGWLDVVPEDIDDSGTVAGYGTEGDVVKGFVYENGTYIIVASPERSNTQIIGISNNREVVGIASSPAIGFMSDLCPNQPVRILSAVPENYATIMKAYEYAVDDDIIQLHDIIFTGEFLFNLTQSVTISGGYDCDYSAVTSSSRLKGNMIINSGTVIIHNIVLE